MLSIVRSRSIIRIDRRASGGGQPRHAQQVVRGTRHERCVLDSHQADEACSRQAGHGLAPADDLFAAFAHPLARPIRLRR
jgi:hypothetical protein